jgi:hypothetical protein
MIQAPKGAFLLNLAFISRYFRDESKNIDNHPSTKGLHEMTFY